jgi:hypothetical protein
MSLLDEQRNMLRKRRHKFQRKYNAPPREDRYRLQEVIGRVSEVGQRKLCVGPLTKQNGTPCEGLVFQPGARVLARYQVEVGDPITLRFRWMKGVVGKGKLNRKG